jgi:BirA family biotin operon repressor/biotin-[acetyl-CoA-carboxylase] ligase
MQALEEWLLPTKHLGRQVLVFAQMDSTNTYAAGLGNDPANLGTVVIAHEQSAGRGQHGRTWQSPSGMGVLMSVVLAPTQALRRPVILAALAANAVCETIRRAANLQAAIKWPNDVLVRGRKVCGILIEQNGPTVIGIGLNVKQPETVFEQAGLPVAASLEMMSGQSLECDQVARQLIVELDDQYTQLLEGNLDRLESAWKWRMGLSGKQVDIECVDRLVCGSLEVVSFETIGIRHDDGPLELILPERIRHITERGV